MGSISNSTASNAYMNYEDHVSQDRTDSSVTIASFLRKRHPQHHLTTADTRSIDLFSFAAQGHAVSVLDDEDELSHRVIGYSAPKFHLLWKSTDDGSESHHGTLNDDVHFARYQFSWKDTPFIVYRVSLWNGYQFAEHFVFILTPRSIEGATIANGHHSQADALLLAAGKVTAKLKKEVYVFDQGRWLKSKSLYSSVDGASWDDVILDPVTKQNLIDDVFGFFDGKNIYKEFQVPWKRGIILHGVPGNGKTISLKAIISALEKRAEPIPSLYVKTLESCNGPSQSIRSIFEKARATAPCLLIFEDLDSLITDKTRSYFLNEVDGLESNDGILMIGSTNHLSTLDPAIRDRPSRFDRKYEFKLPAHEQRVQYAKYWQAKLASNPKVVFPDAACEIVAEMTEEFSFAYLKELFMGSLLAFARGSTGDEPVPAKEQPKTEEDSVTVQTEEEKEQALKLMLRKLELERLAAFEMPEELRENVFVKIMSKEVRMLLEQMDSNAKEQKKKLAAKANVATKTGQGAPA